MSRDRDRFPPSNRRDFDFDRGPPSRGGGGGGGNFGSRDRDPFDRGRPQPMAASGPIVEAVVKWFNPTKGFGFVEVPGSGDAFLHANALATTGRDNVAPGSKIKCRLGTGAKGPQVAEVVEVDESTASEQPRRAAPGGFGGGAGGFGGGGAGGGYGARPQMRGPDMASAYEVAGTVKWFNPEKGFGFVTADDGQKDVFLHVSVLSRSGMAGLDEGQRVSLRVVDGAKGREAVSVSVGNGNE